jgi:cytochrome c oxidase subunit 2
VGLELPKRARKLTLGVIAGSAFLLLSGCSVDEHSDIKRLAMPIPSTKEAQSIYDLWAWSWLAAMITGVFTWGLMFFVFIKYRRRSESEVPVQTRYNLPIEIFYTVAPVMMVIVFFFYTVQAQDDVLHAPKDLQEANAQADANVIVVGQQWSWTFNYTKSDGTVLSEPVWEAGTTEKRPTLWLVKDKTVSFDLYSPDVIHSFWVPNFLFKMDVIPGREKYNHFTFTPTRATGDTPFEGRCAELCGVYHSRMLFDVKVVSQPEFDAHMADLKAMDNTGINLGGEMVRDVAGLEEHSNGGEQ